MKKGVKGIGGWLILLILLLIANIVASGFGIEDIVSGIVHMISSLGFNLQIFIAYLLYLIGYIGIIVFTIIFLKKILKKEKSALDYVNIYLNIFLVYVFFILIIAASIRTIPLSLSISLPEDIILILGAILIYYLVKKYFRESIRVRNTFVN